MSTTTRSTSSDASVDATTSASRRLTEPSPGLLELDREQCLQLLAAANVGRIAVNVPGWASPVIRPVNYIFDERSQSVLFRSVRGSKLHALLRSKLAVFEIDGTGSDGRTAWSVIVAGVTEEVTNPLEIDRLERLGLQTWAPGPHPHWVRIRAGRVSGRRIAATDDPEP